MGHTFFGIVGKSDVIAEICTNFLDLIEIKLVQNYSMISVNRDFVEDYAELAGCEDFRPYMNMSFMTRPLHEFLLEYTQLSKLAYIESVYSYGRCSCSAILYEDQKITIGPYSNLVYAEHDTKNLSVDYTSINVVLNDLGIKRNIYQDEYHVINLHNLRFDSTHSR